MIEFDRNGERLDPEGKALKQACIRGDRGRIRTVTLLVGEKPVLHQCDEDHPTEGK